MVETVTLRLDRIDPVENEHALEIKAALGLDPINGWVCDRNWCLYSIGNRVVRRYSIRRLKLRRALTLESYCSIRTSTTKPYNLGKKMKQSVTERAVDVAVMPGTSQRYYEDSPQDFASNEHAGVSKTGPGEQTSSCNQVHRIHTGEHQYVYVAVACK